MRNDIFRYLAVQIVRPLGLLVHIAILGRAMGAAEFGHFVSLYSSAVFVSIASDLGQRQTAFAKVRITAGTSAALSAIREAQSAKLLGSLVTFMACAGLGVALGLSLGEGVGLALVSVTLPIGDVGSAILRGLDRPNTEMPVAMVEQVLLAGVLVILASAGLITDVSAMMAFAVVGAVRMVVLAARVVRITGPAGLPSLSLGLGSLRADVSVVAGLAASVGLARLPAVLFPAFMRPGQFAVFIAFWTVFQRGELLIGSVIQAGYRRTTGLAAAIANRGSLTAVAGGGIGLLVLAVAAAGHGPLTRIYLSSKYDGASSAAVLAAGLIVLHLPLFGLRTVLQYETRSWTVTTVLATSTAIAALAPHLFSLGGTWAATPYAVVLLAANVSLLTIARRTEVK